MKISAFTVLIIVAAFSREIVDRTYEPIREAANLERQLGRPSGGRLPHPTRPHEPEPAPQPFFDPADKTTIRRLAQTVRIEVAIAVVVLIITALLVDARPAYQVANAPQILTIKSPPTEPPVVWFNLVIQPAASGINQVHVTTETPEGGIANPLQITMELAQPQTRHRTAPQSTSLDSDPATTSCSPPRSPSPAPGKSPSPPS